MIVFYYWKTFYGKPRRVACEKWIEDIIFDLTGHKTITDYDLERFSKLGLKFELYIQE